MKNPNFVCEFSSSSFDLGIFFDEICAAVGCYRAEKRVLDGKFFFL